MSKHEKDVAKGWNIFHWDWFWKPFNERSIAKWLKSPSVDFSAFVHILGLFLGIALMVLALAILYHLVITTLSFKLADTSKPDEVIRNLLLSLAALIGAPFLVWRTILADRQTKTAQKQTAITQEKTRLEEESNYTTLYTKAIELLGATRVVKTADGKERTERAMELRLGAIYALERIARDSVKDHWPIMEVLSAYIRENSPYEKGDEPTPITQDIQAIINVIGRRNSKWINNERASEYRLDLSHCNLMGINIFGNANFTNTYFGKTNFAGASILGANFSNSSFHSANLTHTTFKKCNLKFVELSGATFKNTDLYYTNLYKTNGLVNQFGLTISESIFLINNASHHNISHETPISNSLISDKVSFENSDPTSNKSIPEDYLNEMQLGSLFRLLKLQNDPFSLDWPTLIEEAKKQS